MNISAGLIKGFNVGLEYVDLDEDDGKYLESDANLMIVLSLGIVRIVYINGTQEEEE